MSCSSVIQERLFLPFACGHIVEIEFDEWLCPCLFGSRCYPSYLEAQLSYCTPGDVKCSPEGNISLLARNTEQTIVPSVFLTLFLHWVYFSFHALLILFQEKELGLNKHICVLMSKITCKYSFTF